MAVSANLRISEELKEAFVAALGGSKRFLVVRIESEVLTLVSQVDTTASAEEDFASVADNVTDHEPTFILFRRDITTADERAWTLISFVPDTSKVRLKMLYASSKKDLLRGLGTSLFTDEDFYVTEKRDLTYDSFIHATRKATNEERAALLTEAEQAMAQEKEDVTIHDITPVTAASPVSPASPAAAGGGGAGAGGAVPFRFDDNALAALKAFGADERQCVELKIHPKKEVCELGALDGETPREDVEGRIVTDEPRFYLLNYNGNKVFVYCCPELSQVRARMLYSTGRAAVIATANEHGITFDKTTEMREACEIGDCLAVDAAQGAGDQANKEVSRAVRETRGKRRLNKKVDWSKK